MARTAALVVAAGRGARFGAHQPKQYTDLAGQPVLRHTLARFCADPQITAVACVIHPDDRDLYDEAAASLPLLPPVLGGATRQDSVRLGLESLLDYAPDRVLIHDAARPFVSRDLVDRVLSELEQSPAVIPVLPLVDTLKQMDTTGRVVATPDRSQFGRAQTPQGFHFAGILAAHRAACGQDMTDDAVVAEKAGLTVQTVAGDPDNRKLTTPADREWAEARMNRAASVRVGNGFDVHRLEAGLPLWLGGITIPHSHGLQGHSDADVALHALTDAVLGSFAAGDIGLHFPPSDPRWRGAASDQFLRHAVTLLRAVGGQLSHLDLTIMCEAPKIGPYRQAIARRIAAIVGLPLGQVSVKATTTEGLGFTGRREGIAAQATATTLLKVGL